MRTIVTVASLFFALAANAQESPAETQSIRCGALAHILTVIATPPAFNETMGHSAMFYSDVFGALKEVRTGAAGTNGETFARRDTIEAELRRTWPVKPEAVIREMALCNTWRAEYAPRLAAVNGGTGTGNDVVEALGLPPTAPRPGEADMWRPIVTTGFAAWVESGSKTGGETRALIKKQLEDSIKLKQR